MDKTKEIAREFTDEVYDFLWNDDFSAARNFITEKADTDYWMWLDADDVLDEENLEEAILKELRLDGIIRQEDAVIQRLDADFSGNSLVIPAGKTKSGYSKASKMLLPEEFDAVLTYAQKRRTDLQGAMYRGKAEALPYEMGTQNGCTYCPYRDICGFDEQIEGYEYRKLEKLPKEIVMEKIMAKLEEEKQTWE